MYELVERKSAAEDDSRFAPNVGCSLGTSCVRGRSRFRAVGAAGKASGSGNKSVGAQQVVV